MLNKINIVFVHGYSVTNVNTYGELPLRLKNHAENNSLNIEVNELYLGKYISFNDDVKLSDISKAFESAVKIQLAHIIKNKQQFICITHSTGGPVVRNWQNTFYTSAICPMSHLIMLAPANFGSALAQLGKSKLSRIKSWFDGVEPGQNVLNWLELGSNDSWKLNKEWIVNGEKQIKTNRTFPFVITGQSIDRKLYDNLNSYTGELGSDGVVRVANCNLNAQYIKLEQPTAKRDRKGNLYTNDLVLKQHVISPKTPMRIVSNKSHSGDDMGILKSVKAELNDKKSDETINAIFDCIAVNNYEEYKVICNKFEKETNEVQKNELIETDSNLLFFKRNFFHDRYSQVIFKVIDSEGFPVTNYDLILTAGEQNNPNHLPEGFFIDRQKNKINQETLTYYFNYDVMIGASAIQNSKGEILRNELPGTTMLGFEIKPRPDEGFVRYIPCKINATKDLLQKVLKPNSTTLIEIVLQRIISTNTFQIDKIDKMPSKREGDFSGTTPGEEII